MKRREGMGTNILVQIKQLGFSGRELDSRNRSTDVSLKWSFIHNRHVIVELRATMMSGRIPCYFIWNTTNVHFCHQLRAHALPILSQLRSQTIIPTFCTKTTNKIDKVVQLSKHHNPFQHAFHPCVRQHGSLQRNMNSKSSVSITNSTFCSWPALCDVQKKNLQILFGPC